MSALVTVGWANGSIVNPTLRPSSVGCKKQATQATQLLVPYLVTAIKLRNMFAWSKTALAVLKYNS